MALGVTLVLRPGLRHPRREDGPSLREGLAGQVWQPLTNTNPNLRTPLQQNSAAKTPSAAAPVGTHKLGSDRDEWAEILGHRHETGSGARSAKFSHELPRALGRRSYFDGMKSGRRDPEPGAVRV
jgi:hypothetical protein